MRPHLPARFVLVLSALLVGGLAVASDWSRFRGPNGTGVSSDKNIPVQFSATDGVLWKVAVPGIGNGSPIVAGGKLYLQSATSDGKERMLICLDAASGKPQWTTKIPGARAKTHPKNTLASSTPTTDGSRVYSAFWDGKDVTLYAHDTAGGKELWKKELGSHTSQHGVGHSPMVHDGKVYFMHDHDDGAFLVCLDAADGKELWRKPRKAFRACYSTPLVFDGNGKTELIVTSTAGVTSYDPKTGAENWAHTWKFRDKPLRTVGSSIVADGMILAQSGDGKGDRHLIAIRPGGELVWENTQGTPPYVPCQLSQGEYVYSVNDKGIAGCHVAKTGKQVWTQRLSGDVTASPVLIDGKIYAVTDRGVVHVFEAAPTYKPLATNPLGEDVYATPAVADGRLYLRGRTHLICVGRK